VVEMTPMPALRDWLQLFRAHTAPLEVIIAGAGAALACGTVFDIKVLLFAIMGWLYHSFGYGMNSVEDYVQGFDRNDIHKKHHPHQRGAISVRTARAVVYTGLFLLFIYTLIISSFRPICILLTFIVLIGGVVYNLYGKRMNSKVIPIAFAHSLLFPLGFFGSEGSSILDEGIEEIIEEDIALVVLLCTIFLLFQISYQIFISGDLKDIGLPEKQPLLNFGVRIKDGFFHISWGGTLFSLMLKTLNLLLLFPILYLCSSSPAAVLAVVVLSLLILVMERRLMEPRPWDHHTTTRDMAIMEVLTLFAMVFAITGRIGWWGAFIFIGGGISYFVLLNKYLWGTLLRPAV